MCGFSPTLNQKGKIVAETQGSCLCGEISYAVRGEVLQIVNCHCALCRRMSGAAFSSYVVVREAEFFLSKGQSSLGRYAATERATKHFCKRCGTPIFNVNPHTYPGLVMLYLGTMPTHDALAPRINIFCESKLAWVDAIGSAKSFERSAVRSPS
jgi:hypothetical protein